MQRTPNYPLFSDAGRFTIHSMCQYLFTFGSHRVVVRPAGEFVESTHTYDDGLCVHVTWTLNNRPLRMKATLLRNPQALESWYLHRFIEPVCYSYRSFSKESINTSVEDWFKYQDILATQHYGVSLLHYRLEWHPSIAYELPEGFYEELFRNVRSYQEFENYLRQRRDTPSMDT